MLNKNNNKNPNLGSQSISATKFNEYFTNIGPELAQKFPDSNLNWKLQSCIHNFKFKNISSDFVLSNLKLLGDESNRDSLGIDSKLLKLAAEKITPSVLYMLNLSLSKGIVPSECKLAKVIPVYKSKGSVTEEGNYRPISILPHISKLL